jgi:arabinan endo-1,5-alpha-L-arabinosidase
LDDRLRGFPGFLLRILRALFVQFLGHENKNGRFGAMNKLLATRASSVFRNRVVRVVAVCLPLFVSQARAQIGDVRPVHDPRIIQFGDSFYLFSTGVGIPIRRSKDLISWQRVGAVFTDPPAWAAKQFPGIRYFWAPDISYFSRAYHLYFAVSRFGRNDSRIGLMTNTTLDPKDPNYKWLDQGVVAETHRTDDWNAIDPAVAFDRDNNPWLVMGSFWQGIKMHRLDARTGLLSADDPKMYSLARRPPPDALEAGYMIRRGEFFYLFVSFDYCCRGIHSTYKTMVGRSNNITGPFVDMSGRPMLDGGGTLLLASHGNVIGPGHASVLHTANQDWLVHHFYAADDYGRATLQIQRLSWNRDQWPVVGTPIVPPPPTTRPATKND